MIDMKEHGIPDVFWFEFELPASTKGMKSPRIYDRVHQWGWRLRSNDYRGDAGWNLAASKEAAIRDAANYIETTWAIRNFDRPMFRAALNDVREKIIENEPGPSPRHWSPTKKPKLAGPQMGVVEGWVVTQDGETLRAGFANEAEAEKWLKRRHKQGVDHAVRFDGYDIALIRDGRVVESYRRKILKQRPPARDLMTDLAHREFWQLSGLGWWDAMSALRRKVGPERFRAWIIEETTPWVGRVKVIEELAWNDHNSEWFLNYDKIIETRMLDEDTPASPEIVTYSLEMMIAAST